MDRFEIHQHSHYSNIRIIDSINKIKPILLRAIELHLKGIALTDHEALCGHVEWLETEKELKESGVMPKDFKCALGNEIYLVEKRTPQEKQQYFHAILIAKDDIGHRQLRELSSQSWINSYRYKGMERVPTLKKELEAKVNENKGHLIFSSACLGGEIAHLTTELIQAEKQEDQEMIIEKKEKIDQLIRWLINLFGDDFYLEIAPGTSKDQVEFNKRIKSIAKFYNRKIIIGCDSHFLTKEKSAIHQAFLNSKDGDRDIESFYKDAWLMDEETIKSNLKDIYIDEEIIDIFNNSIEIYNKIKGYNLFHKSIIPEVQVKDYPRYNSNDLKDYPVLYNLISIGDIQERYWANECIKALKEKNKFNAKYLSRLEIEADVIKTIAEKLENKMFAYFNTFQHYIDLFWECGSVIGAGRGSSCSYLSNFLLGITQLDPVEWDLPWFRFLNKERLELPDIDIDLCPSKRPLIFQKIREERGELNVVQVATFGVEAPKAAIGCACRGYRSKECPKGIDVDIAQYMSNLIPIERGFTRSIHDCVYGNEDKNWKPIKELVNYFNQYPGLLEIVLEIENVVCRRGQHASGVILYNKTPFETGALMKSPNGDITTQFDLHKAEACGDTKFDFLLTQQVEKLSVAIDLLIKDKYFDNSLTKREIYNQFFHPERINLKDKRIWDLLKSGKMMDVFQFNTQIGKEAISSIQPNNPIEMSAANGLIRLVAPEGQDRPFDRYVKFKRNLSLWYKEMDEFGLNKEEQKLLEPYYLQDYGVPSSQEALMRMVMDKNISDFTLAEANKARKIVAKKQLVEIPKLKEKFLSQCPSKILGEYAWKTMMEPQMSYSFSIIHALAYSFVAIQSLVLAVNFPMIYWNCACLIVNSQSVEDYNIEENEEIDYSIEENKLEEVEEEEEDIEEEKKEEVKKKNKAANFGKIAIAIGELNAGGIQVAPPDINKSTFTFSPDIKENLIRYGMSGISKVGTEVVKAIMDNRPYNSIEDLTSKIKINKPQVINLIKSGAFDFLGDREKVMKDYIVSISEPKKRVTLQNMKMLIDFKLLPIELEFEQRVYMFNKYLKKFKFDKYFNLDEIAMRFYAANFDMDLLLPAENEFEFKILQTEWDKIYQKHMDKVRPYIKTHSKELLDGINNRLVEDLWNKYCKGSISKWEMDSVSFYSHEHELAYVDPYTYGFSNFFKLPEEPKIDRVIYIKGKKIPLFKIERIAGTVLDKDKAKKTVTLLTTEGVVTVKIFGPIFAHYDKQISERGIDGKKHVIEKSWFSRGEKIIVCGIRREDSFIAKKYQSTSWHLVEKISKINKDGTIEIQRERKGDEEE